MKGKASVIFPTVMAFIMSFLMTAVVTFVNIGFPPGFFHAWMKAWAIAFPGATIVAMIAAPPARLITDRLVRWLDGAVDS